MIVGIPRETAADERRVAVTPAAARRLTAANIRIVVECDAGWHAGYTDESYRRAGGLIVAEPSAVFEHADLVAWVKPPAYQLVSMLRPGMTLLGFQNPLHRSKQIAALRERGIESVAFETIPSSPDTADIDALSAMSRIAGEVAYREGRRQLPQRVQQQRVRALILGCGHAGLAALRGASYYGDEELTVIGNRSEQQDAAILHGAKYFRLHEGNAIFRSINTGKPDLVICAAARRGSHAPRLLDWAELDALGAGAVVVDLVAKAGGNCIATVADNTVTLPNDVVVTHRSNYPSLRPRAASSIYSDFVEKMILQLAKK